MFGPEGADSISTLLATIEDATLEGGLEAGAGTSSATAEPVRRTTAPATFPPVQERSGPEARDRIGGADYLVPRNP